MFQVFHVFQTYVAIVYLYVAKVNLDVACVCNGFQVFSGVFTTVSDVCCKCFNCFERMLQVFHVDIAKVDLVLHMLQWDHLSQPPTTVERRQVSAECPHLHASEKRTRH